MSGRGGVGAGARSKKAIVAEIDVDGATLSEVSRRHGVHVNVLFRWRRELWSAMGTPPDDAATATAAPATRFVPVTLSSPSTPASTLTRPGAIEIVLDGGRTVRVGSGRRTRAHWCALSRRWKRGDDARADADDRGQQRACVAGDRPH